MTLGDRDTPSCPCLFRDRHVWRNLALVLFAAVNSSVQNPTVRACRLRLPTPPHVHRFQSPCPSSPSSSASNSALVHRLPSYAASKAGAHPSPPSSAAEQSAAPDGPASPCPCGRVPHHPRRSHRARRPSCPSSAASSAAATVVHVSCRPVRRSLSPLERKP